MIEKILLVTPPPHDAENITKSKRSEKQNRQQQGRQALPSGLMSIGAYLESKGYEVDIKDFWASGWQEIRNEIKKSNPDAVFSSCLTDYRLSNFKLAKIAKEINPEIVTVIGNVHASVMYEQILSNYPEIDFVVRGEGEITCLELIEYLNKNGNLKDVKGLAFRVENKVWATEKRPLIENLDILPFPTKNRFYLDGSKIATINTSRGCPYGCTFCTMTKYWQNRREKSVEEVLKEVDFLASEGAKYLVFTDDHFTFDKERAIAIAKEFYKYDFQWRMMSRVDRIDLNMLKLFQKNNIDAIAFGVESMSPTVINKMHKGAKVEQVIKAFELGHKAKIPHLDANIMIGLPGETQQTVNETIKGLNIIKPDNLNKYITMIYPGTALYEQAKAMGLKEDYWLSPNVAPFYTLENDMSTLRKWSIQVQLAWYKQRGLAYAAKDIIGIVRDHGISYTTDYLKDGLSKIKLTNFLDLKNKK